MPNSSIIEKVKNQMIREIIKDDLIVKVIDSPDIKKPEKLINSHIFDFNQNPYVINKDITFVTIEVNIPESYRPDESFVEPIVEIWIISHFSHMIVDNIPKISMNRNDYLSILLDKKFNGRTDFGIGKLKLKSNTGGSFQKDYLFRKMIFKTTELNNSQCEVD